ncbi:Protein lifeguard 1 [Araneus ventricosus]|uniref:Protein lifeguard 1 n=1 Tax=Araneus ventricosus TaxID=182803 RepID=A0A4Y2CZ12_ARAVE|nr:Protein lifeguard 1 [Araneus ventricosus]
MAAPQPPPYPGFRPDMAGQAYPQQNFFPGQQYPAGQPYPGQQYPAGQPYPGQQYPAGQPYPGQQYPAGQQYPGPQFPKPQYPNQSGGQPGNYDVSSGDATFKEEIIPGWTGFSDKAIRAVFVRKVYFILMLQLVFSLAVIALFVFERHVKLFVQKNIFCYYISYAIFLGVYIALACCGNLRRKYPTNMILLSIFTMSMSYMLGTISSFYETDVVLMAVGICAAVCLAVSIFSFHTKFDFTSCGGVLFILVWVLFLFGILTIFTYNRIMTTVYAGCGALLFTLFLAYDTQMLMGGKKHELSPEEHVFAAMQIYLDIVYIFMFLLTILGSGRNMYGPSLTPGNHYFQTQSATDHKSGWIIRCSGLLSTELRCTDFLAAHGMPTPLAFIKTKC